MKLDHQYAFYYLEFFSETCARHETILQRVNRFTVMAYLSELEPYNHIPIRTQAYSVTGSSVGHQPGGNLQLSVIRSLIELNKMAVYLGVIWFLYEL